MIFVLIALSLLAWLLLRGSFQRSEMLPVGCISHEVSCCGLAVTSTIVEQKGLQQVKRRRSVLNFVFKLNSPLRAIGPPLFGLGRSYATPTTIRLPAIAWPTSCSFGFAEVMEDAYHVGSCFAQFSQSTTVLSSGTEMTGERPGCSAKFPDLHLHTLSSKEAIRNRTCVMITTSRIDLQKRGRRQAKKCGVADAQLWPRVGST